MRPWSNFLADLMKFVIDNMLKGLLRWLRFLGFDAVELNPRSWSESGGEQYSQRVFLTTSSKHFQSWHVGRKILIPYDKIPDQLNYVDGRLQIFKRAHFLSRCSICNAELAAVDKSEITGEIPDNVADRFEEFMRCPSCRRIYWEGGHVKRLRDKLERMGIPIK